MKLLSKSIKNSKPYFFPDATGYYTFRTKYIEHYPSLSVHQKSYIVLLEEIYDKVATPRIDENNEELFKLVNKIR